MPELPGSVAHTTDTHTNSAAPSLGGSWGALILAVLEALCLFAVTVARAGIVLGSSALVAVRWATFIHRDIIRIPVLLLAVTGSLFNLYLLWNAQRLRNAPAAAWRKRPQTRRERWRIGFVFCLSILTLATAAGEIYFHRKA